MLITFKKEHIDCIVMREHEKLLGITLEELRVLEETSVAITGMYDGRVIACGGVMVNRFGSGDIWLIPSIYCKDYNLIFLKNVKKWLIQVQKDLNLSRLQTHTINDDLHDKWMIFLGFEKEGVMKKSFNGLDYAMWGKVCL